ncbi:MAG: hypothetical protein HYY86_03155 [Candidatus Harrisonbacteria bacterium]|nr:hypothetical protein [Candidatus Harrisonbacteria bacterium]
MLYLKVLSFQKIREFIIRLFTKSDSYLLVEILNHYVQITLFRVYPDEKLIFIKKSWIKEVPDFTAYNILQAFSFLLKKAGNPNKYKIILSLDSFFATTIYSSVALVRPRPKEIIDEADMDNLISQAIWRFFDRQRLKAAKKMGIDDVDVILSDVRIRGIKLDGHKIINPIGFKAKAVEIFFSQTFLPRELLRGIRDFLPKGNIALITETGTAMSHILSKALGQDRFLVANLFPDQTAIFSASAGRLSHLDDFEWGEKDLIHLLGRHLQVDPAAARLLVKNYADRNASEGFLRRFENILFKELQIFANGLESLVPEDNNQVYLNPFFTLPPVVFSDRFQNRLQKNLTLLPLSTNLITEKLGYEVQFKKSASVKNLWTVLAAFLEINFLPQNDKMSHLANRRVRWLVT